MKRRSKIKMKMKIKSQARDRRGRMRAPDLSDASDWSAPSDSSDSLAFEIALPSPSAIILQTDATISDERVEHPVPCARMRSLRPTVRGPAAVSHAALRRETE